MHELLPAEIPEADRAHLPHLKCRLQMQFVRRRANHESRSIREWDIVLGISHFHVFGLEVAIHHETSHKEGFTEPISRQLPGIGA